MDKDELVPLLLCCLEMIATEPLLFFCFEGMDAKSSRIGSTFSELILEDDELFELILLDDTVCDSVVSGSTVEVVTVGADEIAEEEEIEDGDVPPTLAPNTIPASNPTPAPPAQPFDTWQGAV